MKVAQQSPPKEKGTLEAYFNQFRRHIVGLDATFRSPYGEKQIIYADWIASGRLYEPIEEKLCREVGPLVGNTHSESSETGMCMTHAYHLSHKIIKQHVHANENDVIITSSTGMTGCLAKFQRILGLRMPESMMQYVQFEERERPVVFITHLEHHSNQTSWLESVAEVVVIPPGGRCCVSVENLEAELLKYQDRKVKIGSFSACSNVTGVEPDYHALAKMMHQHGGLCFVDFAASAPYVDIHMHPEEEGAHLDAIFFSPHKFLGGPGSSGVVIFNKKLYKNRIPDHPGGGTVLWTNPWGEHHYFDEIEIREDGGTPGFLQAMKAAMAIRLKEKMGVPNIRAREKELVRKAFDGLRKVEGLHILLDEREERLGVFSFYIEGIHHNLIVRLLNDLYGIQVRGGCSCAGTYGHYLLHVDKDTSKQITELIDQGDLSLKPGWVRMSIHPTMTDEELDKILFALQNIAGDVKKYADDYVYDRHSNEFYHRRFPNRKPEDFEEWFKF